MDEKSINIPATLKEIQNQGEKATYFRLGSANPGQEGAPPVVILSLLKDETEVISTIVLDLEQANHLQARLTHHIERASQNVT
jgi:hypothetical protein